MIKQNNIPPEQNSQMNKNQSVPPQNQQPNLPHQQPNLPPPDLSSQIKLIKTVVNNMTSGDRLRLMLSGETGLGKTTFGKQFAKIFGLPIVVIEIPHTVEEQLINIPFIVFDPKGGKTQGYEQIETDGARVELGKSHLASTLAKLHKIPDSSWANEIRSMDPTTKNLIAQYEKEYPGKIDLVRLRYDRILFLDEYYRQTTPSIRHILRNILDNRIGNDPIPKGTYVIYASNLTDVGGSMDAKAQNAPFRQVKFPAPTKDQWLHYTVSKAIGNNVKIKQDVVNAFNDV